MSQKTHTGKLLAISIVLFIAAITGVGYYGFRGTMDKEKSPAIPAQPADPTAPPAANANGAAPADPVKAADTKPTVAQLQMLMAPQPDDIVYGSAKAPVTILAYASLSCPHCAHFEEEVFPDLQTEFIDTGKMRLVYRHFPHNEPALRAAQLVNCADAKQRPAFIKALFDAQGSWAYSNNFLQDLKPIVAVGGIDSAAFDACIANKAGETRILELRKMATDLGQVNSVPTFFINGAPFTDSPTLAHFQAAIAKAAGAK